MYSWHKDIGPEDSQYTPKPVGENKKHNGYKNFYKCISCYYTLKWNS